MPSHATKISELLGKGYQVKAAYASGGPSLANVQSKTIQVLILQKESFAYTSSTATAKFINDYDAIQL
jgi:hypothetical protein